MTYFRIAILAGLFALTSVAWQDNDPDRAVKGGNFPAGWMVRPDRGTPDQLKFSIAGEAYTTSRWVPPHPFYRSDWTKDRRLQTLTARLTQKVQVAPFAPDLLYGLMIGGSDLAGAPTGLIPTSWCAIRANLHCQLARATNARWPVMNWTANPA